MQEASPSDLDPHAVSSVFKAYLRERMFLCIVFAVPSHSPLLFVVPEPILTRTLSPLFDVTMSSGTGVPANPGASLGLTSFGGGAMAGQGTTVGTGIGSSTTNVAFAGRLPTAKTLTELKALMGRLPRANFDLLHQICSLLRHTAKRSKTTKMPLSNLLLLFCPSLQLSPVFLKVLVERQDYLYGDGPMGEVQHSDEEDGGSTTTTSTAPRTGPGLPSRPNAFLNAPGSSHLRETSTKSSNRAASVYAPSSIDGQSLDSILLPSRPLTPSDMNPHPPATPSSTSSGRRKAARRPSLNFLFNAGKSSSPNISAPIPYVAPSQTSISSEAPLIDFALPEDSIQTPSSQPPTATDPPQLFINSAPAPMSYLSRTMPGGGPFDVDESVRLVERNRYTEYSPPPQIGSLGSSPRNTGDDWALSVLKAARGDHRQ